MAASTKKRPRRYHTPGVVSGNLARELNHQELERRLEEEGGRLLRELLPQLAEEE